MLTTLLIAFFGLLQVSAQTGRISLPQDSIPETFTLPPSLPGLLMTFDGTELVILSIGQYDSLRYATALTGSLARETFELRESLLITRDFRDRYKGLYKETESDNLELSNTAISLRDQLVFCNVEKAGIETKLGKAKIENWVWRVLFSAAFIAVLNESRRP